MADWRFVSTVALLCLLGWLASGWALLLHLGGVLTIVTLLGLVLLRFSAERLHVEQHLDRVRVTAGDSLVEEFTASKRGWWPASWIEVRPGPDDPATDPLRLTLFGRDWERIERQRLFSSRGRYDIGSGTVHLRDPFGLFDRTVETLDPVLVTVQPRPIEAQWALRRILALAGPRAVRGDTLPGRLRPYTIGDPLSRVHWRSTARTGTMMIREPEGSRNAIWLLVDLGGREAERTAGVAAYLVHELSRRHRVGAIIAGTEAAHTLEPREGRPDALLEGLALVPAAEAPQAERLLRAVTRAADGDTLVFISSNVQGHLLRRLQGISGSATIVDVRLSEGSRLRPDAA